MSTIQDYKCPCCGAPLGFDAASQKLHCQSCGTDFELETMQQLDEEVVGGVASNKYNWEDYQPRNYEQDGDFTLSSYNCPSCGATIDGDDTLGSTICPYCGNSTIVKVQFEGTLKPDFVIPFKIDKKAAIAAFERAYQKAPFLPDEFKDKKRIEDMVGVYVPFWTFDCDCSATIKYNAQRVSAWSDSKYNYTKTDFFRLIRSGSIGFSKIPVDGSKKADDAYMESIEPFDYEDAMDFNSAYLSGFLADRYDVSAEECQPRANERIQKSTEDAFAATTSAYTAVQPINSFVEFSDGKIRYSLLPVWMLNIKYGGENYKFAINGQTGKTVGEYPICKKKRNLYFVKALAISLGITLAAALLYINLL